MQRHNIQVANVRTATPSLHIPFSIIDQKKTCTHHTMTLELRVSVENAVCRGVVSRRVHGIGTSLVE
jgi:hypothetical protein